MRFAWSRASSTLHGPCIRTNDHAGVLRQHAAAGGVHESAVVLVVLFDPAIRPAVKGMNTRLHDPANPVGKPAPMLKGGMRPPGLLGHLPLRAQAGRAALDDIYTQ